MEKYLLQIEAYLNGGLSAEDLLAFEKALAESEDLNREVMLFKMEEKALDRLQSYIDENQDLEAKTWLFSLYSSAIMLGSFWSRAKAMDASKGKKKSDQRNQHIPGANV